MYTILSIKHRRPGGLRAFTLIELLVVVAIIALLISILLPSLKAAREQAKAAACAAQLKGMGSAMATYYNNYDGYLIGGPGTSGYETTQYNSAEGETWHAEIEKDLFAVNPWDWAGPLATLGMGTDFGGTRGNRLFAAKSGLFECPNKRALAIPYGNNRKLIGHPDWPIELGFSYNSMRDLLFFAPGRGPSGSWVSPTEAFENNLVLPRGYQPRIEKIGTEALKVFLMDGARWLTYAEGSVEETYNVSSSPTGGGPMSDSGPASGWTRSYVHHAHTSGGQGQGNEGSFYVEERDRERVQAYAYRHRKADHQGANGLFYDGHVEWKKAEDWRMTPQHFWPKKTRLAQSELQDDLAQYLRSYGMFEGDFYTIRH